MASMTIRPICAKRWAHKMDIFILQPTRVCSKGIGMIELVQRLEDPNAILVISHASGDEGDEYERRLKEYADR